VVVFALMKVILLACTFRTISEDALITVGDRIASFLSRKDKSTVGVGLMDKSSVKNCSTQSEGEAIPFEYHSKMKPWGFHFNKQSLLTFSF
jgi:hypothetical protein